MLVAVFPGFQLLALGVGADARRRRFQGRAQVSRLGLPRGLALRAGNLQLGGYGYLAAVVAVGVLQQCDVAACGHVRDNLRGAATDLGIGVGRAVKQARQLRLEIQAAPCPAGRS